LSALIEQSESLDLMRRFGGSRLLIDRFANIQLNFVGHRPRFHQLRKSPEPSSSSKWPTPAATMVATREAARMDNTSCDKSTC
jgi:hypothetical protein